MMNLYKGRRKWVLLGRRGAMVSLWMTAMEQMSNCRLALILCNRKGKQILPALSQNLVKGYFRLFTCCQCRSIWNLFAFDLRQMGGKV